MASAEENTTPAALLRLVPFVGTLVTVASNPEQWLRQYVFELIAEWVVGGILDATEYVLGWIIFGYQRTTSILLGVIPQLKAPFRIIENAVVGVINTIYGVAIGVAQTAGLAGPPAAAFAIVLLGTVAVAIALAIWKTIPVTDAVDGALGAFTK